jgi:hypothetical protein
MAPVEVARIPARNASHDSRHENISRFEQKMKMAGNQTPSVASRLALPDDLSQPTQEIITVSGITKNLPALQAPRNDMVKHPRCNQSGVS